MRKQSAILCLVALLCSACGTVSQAPLDDAYYWLDKKEAAAVAQTEPTTPDVSPAADTPSPVSPAIEYINVQDTTVTIKIKR